MFNGHCSNHSIILEEYAKSYLFLLYSFNRDQEREHYFKVLSKYLRIYKEFTFFFKKTVTVYDGHVKQNKMKTKDKNKSYHFLSIICP